MEVRLVIEKGRTPKRYVVLRKAETLVGRLQNSDLRIISAEVSRRHCLLQIERGLFYVEDLGSANGTILNGEAVDGRAVVRPGDRLEIGPLRFVVEYELTQEAVERLRKQGRPRPLPDEEFETLPEAEEMAEEDTPAVAEADEVADAADPFALGLDDEEESEEDMPELMLDLDEPWDMPSENDMRDILGGLDDSDPPSGGKKRG